VEPQSSPAGDGWGDDDDDDDDWGEIEVSPSSQVLLIIS